MRRVVNEFRASSTASLREFYTPGVRLRAFRVIAVGRTRPGIYPQAFLQRLCGECRKFKVFTCAAHVQPV